MATIIEKAKLIKDRTNLYENVDEEVNIFNELMSNQVFISGPATNGDKIEIPVEIKAEISSMFIKYYNKLKRDLEKDLAKDIKKDE